MRVRARVDKNQSEIVKGLRQAHRSVFVASSIGDGFPDLVVGFQGRTYLIEIKTQKGCLTGDQEEFYQSWRGAKIHVVKSLEQALDITG